MSRIGWGGRAWLERVLAVALALGGGSAAGSPRGLVEQGNEAWAEERYEQALDHYTAAQVDAPRDPVIQYDLGAVLYRLQRHEEARQAFEAAYQALGPADGPLDLARDAAYNEGNSLFRAERYKEAVQRFRRALELDPTDADAKHNLEMALRMLEQPPREQDPRDGEPEPSSRDSGPSGAEPEPTPGPPQPPPPQAPERSPTQGPQGVVPRMTREEAERLLDALERAEQDARRGEEQAARSSRSGVDW